MIGWNLSNLKGIHPSLCTHRIFLEEDSRPSREAQRRLIPKVWDVVKDKSLNGLMKVSYIPSLIVHGSVRCMLSLRRRGSP